MSDNLPQDAPWTGDFDPPAENPGPAPAVRIAAPDVRTPRGGISINGKRFDHMLVEAEITNNRFAQADSFRCVLTLDERDGTALGPSWWGDQARMEAEIFAGLDPRQPPGNSLILGRVDDVEIDFAKRLVSLSGRDFTADLLETQTTEKWPNKTASEIASDLAGRHGLTPQVEATTQRSGHYYQLEYARLTDATTEWNLLTYLAEQEGFDCYVRGRTLYFGPPPDPRTAPRWTLQYEAPGTTAAYALAKAGTIRMRRNLTVAQDVIVRVVSWNARQKKAFTVTRRSNRGAGRGTGGRFASSTPYVFRRAGLTEEQAIREAERLLRTISERERVLDIDGLPGLPDLDVRTIMVLRGTGSSWDQEYHLDEIRRSISFERGFSMSLRARNVAPESTAAL